MGVKRNGSQSSDKGPEARRQNCILRWLRISSPGKSPFEHLEIDEWNRLNVKGALFGIAAALPHV